MLSDLLRRTADRYERARQLVLSEHPTAAGEELEQLLADMVQRLANQDMHQKEHERQRRSTTESKQPSSGVRPSSSCR